VARCLFVVPQGCSNSQLKIAFVGLAGERGGGRDTSVVDYSKTICILIIRIRIPSRYNSISSSVRVIDRRNFFRFDSR
jgi:hypothetical protein